MQNQQLVEGIREFLRNEQKIGKNVIIYKRNPNISEFLSTFKIGVKLDQYKEIILQEETGLELGGINKKSFSLIFPIHNLNLIDDGRITLLGHEINSLKEKSIDFGIFILMGINKTIEKEDGKLRQLNFISNSIEGFLIRSIPRRFWCRISNYAKNNNISFEFLGNAIQYLFKQKFGNLVDSMEILFINSYPDSIDEFRNVSSEIFRQIKQGWIDKIEEWKKKVDCEYDWGCEICPYRDECYNLKKVLIKREELQN